MDQLQVVDLVRTRLSSLFAIEKIILFGSRAGGGFKDQSDWDFLVIVQSDIPFVQRQAQAFKALGKHEFSVDLLVYTPAEAEQAARIIGSSVYWAQREGRTVLA
jgi:predicted nucleotidyltransferase